MTEIGQLKHPASGITPTPFVLCADDFGIAPGVSHAICELIAAGRLSATSCMTSMPFWPEHARWLAPLQDKADIGLHLTLTDQRPLGPMPKLAPEGRLPSLGALLSRAFTGRLERAEIAAELARQYEAFVAAFGRDPDFIDGHQHVHVLPVVRSTVLDLLRRHAGPRRPWLRSCHEPLQSILRLGVSPLRAGVISVLARRLDRTARRLGIATNNGFRGVYDFSGDEPYGRLFERFVDGAAANLLVMCHPGQVDHHLRAVDTLTDQREVEFAYFMSESFAETLHARKLRLARLSA